MDLHFVLLVILEGLIFGILALGVYLSFSWLRFPDLTPDGSFVLGGCVYAKCAIMGLPIIASVFFSIIGGFFAGCLTALLYKKLKIPAIICGLLVSLFLYSFNWGILAKPNQYIEPNFTMIGNFPSQQYTSKLLLFILPICVILVSAISILKNSIWGIKIKAIGENPNLEKIITKNGTLYFMSLMGLSNAIISLAGLLFSQRSFSADVSNGIGQTITGLIALIFGLIIYSGNKVFISLVAIVFGAILYKALTFFVLQLGLSPEYFRALSAIILILTFSILTSKLNFLNKLKWN